jgi:hypothetical protein
MTNLGQSPQATFRHERTPQYQDLSKFQVVSQRKTVEFRLASMVGSCTKVASRATSASHILRTQLRMPKWLYAPVFGAILDSGSYDGWKCSVHLYGKILPRYMILRNPSRSSTPWRRKAFVKYTNRSRRDGILHWTTLYPSIQTAKRAKVCLMRVTRLGHSLIHRAAT